MELNENHTKICGAPEGYDAKLLLQELDRASGTVLFIAREIKRAEAMRRALDFYRPETSVQVIPAWDCPPYSRISPNTDIVAKRLGGLSTILRLEKSDPFVCLTTLNAAMQLLPSKDWLSKTIFRVSEGQRISEENLKNYFLHMGFVRAPMAVSRGEFAIRGGIIDVFPPGMAQPVRMDFFGDVVDGLRTYDPVSQRTTGKLKNAEFSAVSEVVLTPDAISRFRSMYRMEFGNPGPGDHLYDSVTEGRGFAGMEHWLPFFHAKLETLFGYLPDAAIFVDDGVPGQWEKRWETVAGLHESRVEFGRVKPKGGDYGRAVRPELVYLSLDQGLEILKDRTVKWLYPQKLPIGLGVLDAAGRPGKLFSVERRQESLSLLEALATYVQTQRKSTQVVIACWTEGSRERLKQMLVDHGVERVGFIENAGGVTGKPGDVSLAVWQLNQGFVAPGYCIVSEQDIFGERIGSTAATRKKASDFLQEVSSLAQGELVVHSDHGVGRYVGLQTITVSGAPHDCLALEYAGGDKLYVPVENIEVLSRYGSGDIALDRLGAAAWQERKSRLKKNILEIADQLMRVAAQREVRSGPTIVQDDQAWENFLARFLYNETDDQNTAAADVMEDLSSGTPMDRLVCGDTGFGKTEIAMRAAFLAAMSGFQTALVAPTTLLVNQHLETFESRFHGFPVVVRQLSRIVGAKEAANTKSGISDGAVDIAIGTHALLSKSINFKKLGLLIIDEEHSFGVAQKERLKQLRTDVHVLTLSATPIPRSMQLALSSVRDLSIIATPPADRLSVRTYVTEFDPVTIREALLREHYRRGQSFFVVPRIRDMAEIEEFLSDLVPEIKYISAHGQLPAKELESRTTAFFNGEFDVLLSTTIIASGLDVPTANTIVIHRSDRFGLAQLHQIRGRVGRSGLRAYAFITYERNAKLTEGAKRRLRIFESLDSLGAGFSLAAHDLDIRGAGNLLGKDQSGHIREVGVELYQSMLKEAIAKLNSGQSDAQEIGDEYWTPELNLGLAVGLPEFYVSDPDVRLGLYRRMASIASGKELEGIAAELVDRFGSMPPETSTLIKLLHVKTLCRKAGISRIDAGPKGATVSFQENSYPDPRRLVHYIESQAGRAKLRGNNLVLRRNWHNAESKLNGVATISKDLAKIASLH